MRILYSHRTKSADGQYVHIRALTEKLAARGHDVLMVGPEGESRPGAAAARRLDAKAGAKGLRARLPRAAGEAAELAYSAPAYARLARAATRHRADILYERYNLFFHAGERLARVRRLPFLLEVNAPLVAERARHGGLALKKLAQASETRIWRAADLVLPVTGVLARMVEDAGVPPEQIAVIPNGVDEEFLGSIDPSPVRARYGLAGKLVLGFTGFVRDWHGLDRVVRFLADPASAGAHLLLVGDGDERPRLETLAAELGVADRFTATGVVQREDVAAHVAAFDIALQPAVVAYASPLKLFEYMAQGRAIVAPATPNIREILADREDALLFPDGDEAALRQALATLIAAPDLRARLGGRAAATLRARDYTWAGNAARVEKFAERLFSGGR